MPEATGTNETPKTYKVIQDPHPEAIVLHCSDPRFQDAFESFIREELGLAKGQYVPIVVGGASSILAYQQLLPKEFNFLRSRLEQYAGRFPSLNRVIFIGHEDCKYYKMLLEKPAVATLFQHIQSFIHKSREDMGLAWRIVQQILPHFGRQAEFYYARFTDENHDRVAFERVDPGSR